MLPHPLHYGASSEENWKLMNLPKLLLPPSFSLSLSNLFSFSWNSPWKIFKEYFNISNIHFHNEWLHWEKNHFLVIFRGGFHLQRRKISTFSVKLFSCFLQKYPVFFITNLKILFFWLNICSYSTNPKNNSWLRNE